MKKIAIIAVILAVSAACRAEQILKEFHWPKISKAGRIIDGEVLGPKGERNLHCLFVENRKQDKATIKILTIDSPGVTKSKYAVVGKVAYRDVEGEGYLEMWSSFGEEGPFFSRTLGEGGPTQPLTGDSNFRRFVLPFYAKDGKRPDKITLNVVLPSTGRVWVGPLRLVQYEAGEDPLAASGAWWSDRRGGLIGGIGGSVIGLMGAVVGILGGTGKARRTVMTTMKIIAGVGGACLAGGIVAVLTGQPYGVYYPLLLGGGITAVVFGGMIPLMSHRYQQAELSKMQSLDAAASR